MATPKADVKVDVQRVQRLLQSQHPDLAELPLVAIASGWDNVMFRLGDLHCVRLPRRQTSAALIKHEQRVMPKLAPLLPVAVPVPFRTGLPAHDYPYHYSILPWFPGDNAATTPLREDQALLWADFLLALHSASDLGIPAPDNPSRGVPLMWRKADVEDRMTALQNLGEVVTARVRNAWRTALAAPVSGEPCWIHGDLHGRNVLTQGGRLSAVIDWGDVTIGDRATDLASFWALFGDSNARRQGLTHYLRQYSEPGLLERSRGWAVFFGITLLQAADVSDGQQVNAARALLRSLE